MSVERQEAKDQGFWVEYMIDTNQQSEPPESFVRGKQLLRFVCETPEDVNQLLAALRKVKDVIVVASGMGIK